MRDSCPAEPATFRRRLNEHRSPIGDIDALEFAPKEKRTFPLIAMGLFLTAIGLSETATRTNMFAIMKPRLVRLLSRYGINFEQTDGVMK